MWLAAQASMRPTDPRPIAFCSSPANTPSALNVSRRIVCRADLPQNLVRAVQTGQMGLTLDPPPSGAPLVLVRTRPASPFCSPPPVSPSHSARVTLPSPTHPTHPTSSLSAFPPPTHPTTLPLGSPHNIGVLASGPTPLAAPALLPGPNSWYPATAIVVPSSTDTAPAPFCMPPRSCGVESIRPGCTPQAALGHQ